MEKICDWCGFEVSWYCEKEGFVTQDCPCDDTWNQILAERDLEDWGSFSSLADVVDFWNGMYEEQQSEIRAEAAWSQEAR